MSPVDDQMGQIKTLAETLRAEQLEPIVDALERCIQDTKDEAERNRAEGGYGNYYDQRVVGLKQALNIVLAKAT